jgi:hypothetical protein
MAIRNENTFGAAGKRCEFTRKWRGWPMLGAELNLLEVVDIAESDWFRNIATAALFLMPGVGAQGAPLELIKSAGGNDGFGAYASSSRSVLYSFAPDKTKDENWREIVRESAASEAKKLRDAINDEFARV